MEADLRGRDAGTGRDLAIALAEGSTEVRSHQTPPGGVHPGGRPVDLLPLRNLVRISLYWLGLTAIWAGLHDITTSRLQYQGLVPKGGEGSAYVAITLLGSIVAVVVQPTVGSISDYTVSRWGRRKPYIFIGSLLDLVFLYGIASSNTILAIAAFFTLLQLSSNTAQGPFQGYVPDLVPAPQVGLASSLVGLMQSLGNLTGFLMGAIALYTNQFFLATMALGAIEFVTMLSVVLRVPDTKQPKDRAGRSWPRIAVETWAPDVLRERSFVWLVASRFFVLMGGGMLIAAAVFYLGQTFGLDQQTAGTVQFAVLGVGFLATVVSVVPAGRVSDRTGRKPVIWVSCAFGIVGMIVLAFAPDVPVVIVGVGLVGASGGIFLAVDWALMTDIIPKASSGRFMGMSNVATGLSGIVAIATGLNLMDAVNAGMGYGTGPRAAYLLAAGYYALGALLLWPVDPRRREDAAPEPGDLKVASAPAVP